MTTNRSARVIIVDDEASLRETLEIALRRVGYEVESFARADAALVRLDQGGVDLVLTDVRMPGLSGIDLLREIRRRGGDVEVIVMTAFARAEDAVEVMKAGAYDYLTKPFNLEELRVLVERALDRQRLDRENRSLKAQLGAARREELVAASPAMQEVRRMAERVAAVDSTVLITGESGVGKEVVARFIHHAGRRADGPFVAVNCGALPDSLIESELFGYEKGAFTGADRARAGLLEQAAGGTMFLDEVGELPLAAQVKLLRVSQEQRVRRLGAQDERNLDARFIAATNRNLEDQVREGSFREDLYYRLNVVRIEIPPLRTRPDDLQVLVPMLARAAGLRLGLPVTGVDPAVIRRLAGLPLPGNVRELQNILERAVVMGGGGQLTVEHLPAQVSSAAPVAGSEEAPTTLPPGFDLEAWLARQEESLMRTALVAAGGVKMRAAELLGLSFRQFRYKADKYGL